MIELIKELRAKTNLGMNECKQALLVSNNNVDEAIDYLLKKNLLKNVGVVIAPTEGAVYSHVINNDCATLFELNCETDFAAKSEIFQDLLKKVAVCTTKHEALDIVNKTAVVLKEKLFLRRFETIHGFDDEIISSYNHPNGKISVLLTTNAPHSEKSCGKMSDSLIESILLQIAAMNPKYLQISHISEQDIEKQEELFKTQLKEDPKPKPQAIWHNIIVGKFNKYYSEVCLLEQDSIITPGKTIRAMICEESKNLDPSLKNILTISGFHRFERGEDI